MKRSLWIVALVFAPLAASAQTSRWQTHRSDARLREGMILRGHLGQAHLRIDTRPTHAGRISELDTALASAHQLNGDHGDVLAQLVRLTTDVFPRGDERMPARYLERVAKPAQHG